MEGDHQVRLVVEHLTVADGAGALPEPRPVSGVGTHVDAQVLPFIGDAVRPASGAVQQHEALRVALAEVEQAGDDGVDGEVVVPITVARDEDLQRSTLWISTTRP